MKTRGALVVGVADLLRRPGNHRAEHLEAVLEGLEVTGSRVVPGQPVVLDLRLESVNEGVVARGTLRAEWESDCRRCLRCRASSN